MACIGAPLGAKDEIIVPAGVVALASDAVVFSLLQQAGGRRAGARRGTPIRRPGAASDGGVESSDYPGREHVDWI
ncbi:MAG: hypothetical protein ACRELA_10000, partial [Candidatus Rokuibacteriota bacterium]